MISIKVRLTIDGYIGKTILFKDSMLLLPLSLRKLCKAFNVAESKGHFPFKLDDINYIGKLPSYNLWPGVTKDQYVELYKKYTQGKLWNFKYEALKYCIQDCVALHQVLTKFNELIFKEFSLNIHKSLTLSSLSMKIYKTHHMPANTIYQLLGPAEKDIRQSYTGGAVDVYIPFYTPPVLPASSTTTRTNVISVHTPVKIYSYDVNSLYPYVRAETPMPVGKPTAFTGDIRAIEPQAFGFFYCEITSPDYLEHPILQRRIKTSQGYRTIAGLGTWKGWVFSSEMDNAMRFDYKFTILKGYEFEKGVPFKSYVLKMYELRMQYSKDDPMNYVAKLLMNSLYGKFGMNSTGTLIEMFDTTDPDQVELLEGMLDAYNIGIHDFIKIDNHVITIRDDVSRFQYSDETDTYHGTEVNVGIASAVTAGGRMWMTNVKNKPNVKLFYSDTDSAIVDTPLDDHMVGPHLGQFKLEHEITHAVFLAPKVYAFKTVDEQEIVKIKGLSKGATGQETELNLSNFVNLLVEDSSRQFTQEKWFKKTLEGDIKIGDVAYTLKVTSNKRMPIYQNGVFTGTKPFHYNDLTDSNGDD